MSAISSFVEYRAVREKETETDKSYISELGITTQVVDEAEGVLLWGEECLIVLWGSGILCIKYSRTDSTLLYLCVQKKNRIC